MSAAPIYTTQLGPNSHAAVAAATASGYDAWVAGRVRKEGDRKAVVVPGLDLVFEGDTLQVR